MSKEFVIGLDLGTTSVKACVFDLEGNLVADAEQMNTFHYPQPGWSEQDPVEIERSSVLAVKEAIQKVNVQKNEIVSLGFCAAMHSLICMNESGEPISPALIWSDGRSYPQAERLMEATGKDIYAKTGTPIHPMSPLLKLLWMKETQYEPYQKASYFLSLKEYVLQCWFNQRVIDYSMASATGMFNPKTLRWEDEALELAGITKEQLSEIVPPTYVLKGIKPEIAEEMGVNPEMPFVIGAADGQLANLGIGAILPGEVAVSVGTSSAIRQLTQNIQIDESRATFCYSFTADHAIIGGPSNNGGIVLQWLKDLLNDKGDFGEFLAQAETVAPGAEGLIFLPYLNGERAPLWNQQAKGNFYGVAITHQREHFIRAVLEGITFNLYQIGKALERLAGAPKKIYVNGGLARSPLWLQMMADVFEADIYVSESHHSAAWGAAWTALVALEKVQSFAEIKKHIPMGKITKPNKENSAVYKQIYANYEQLVQDLSKFFK